MMDWTHGILLALVEGLTEFLPVSSTGHIVLTSYFLGINNQSFVKDYTVMVQFGAIASVMFLYWRRFFQSFDFYKKLTIGFLPAGILGLTLKNHIDRVLGSTLIVAWALLVGGIVLLFIDKWMDKKNEKKISTEGGFQNSASDQSATKLNHLQDLNNITYLQAFWIGLSQCVAFVPGVSRSAASIIGGMWQGLNRQTAAEFSFLLAVPTLTGATLIKLIKIYPSIRREEISILLVGNAVAFVVALLTMRFFIFFLGRYGFSLFGWYRIVIGGLFLIFV